MVSTTPFHLLLVDDDNLIIDSIRLILPKEWQMTALRQAPKSTDTTVYHAAFVDMHLTGQKNHAEGPGIIAQIVQNNPHIEVIAISGDLSMDLMELCLKNGASRFLPKPLQPDEVIKNLEKIEALWQMRNLESRGSSSKTYQWIGQGPESQALQRQVASLRGEPGPILIEGETGTGKEVVFKLLNQQEPNRPTVTVNVAGIPENLFESEMFGHVKGAFTGADGHKAGLAEAAHGGDLFLDEIEALPISMQVKLLRFLESGEVRRVGSKTSTHVKVRVIAASNRNLSELVREGKFREDLLYRLNGKTILLPPLRQRRADLMDLAQHFLQKERPRTNKIFSSEALQALQEHQWPGNVRELKRVIEQLSLSSPLPIIRPQDVQAIVKPHTQAAPGAPLDLAQGLHTLLEGFELQVIRSSLDSNNNDVEKTADQLKISRSNLYQKIKNFKLMEDT